MATRPVFFASSGSLPVVEQEMVPFKWVPGQAESQKQLCIASLHQAAEAAGLGNLLEISTKSDSALGQGLSAFNLTVELPRVGRTRVESAFQSSKVFEHGGPLVDAYLLPPQDVRSQVRSPELGALVAFELAGTRWPLTPTTAFYDWLYVSALLQHMNLAEHLLDYDGFTDIEFNPARSVNCQARSAALFLALDRRMMLPDAVRSRDEFISAHESVAPPGRRATGVAQQGGLGF